MSFPLLLLVSLIAGLVGAMTGMGGGVVLIRSAAGRGRGDEARGGYRWLAGSGRVRRP